MNFYTPTFRAKAKAQFGRLDPWQQEAALDAIERMLHAVLPPAVARQMTLPFVEDHDTVINAGGRQHVVFLVAELKPDVGQKPIFRVGVVSTPPP